MNDRRTPPSPGVEGDEEASEEGREGGGGTSGLDALYGLVNHCDPISRPKKTDGRTGRAVAAIDLNRGASEQDRTLLSHSGTAFEPARAGTRKHRKSHRMSVYMGYRMNEISYRILIYFLLGYRIRHHIYAKSYTM